MIEIQNLLDENNRGSDNFFPVTINYDKKTHSCKLKSEIRFGTRKMEILL